MTPETAAELISDNFFSTAPDTVSLFRGSWANYVAFVDDRWVFRFARNPDTHTKLLVEIAFLQTLGEQLPFVVPRYLHFARQPSGYPYAIGGYPRIPGQPLGLTPQNTHHYAVAIAGALVALHRLPLTVLAAIELPIRTAETYPEILSWYRESLSRSSVDKGCTQLPEVVNKALLLLENEPHTSQAITHGDLHAKHLLITDGRAQPAIIDFGQVSVSDPALDVAGLLHSYGEQFVRLILDHYDGENSGVILHRARIWCLMAPLEHLIYGYRQERSDLVSHGLATLKGTLELLGGSR